MDWEPELAGFEYLILKYFIDGVPNPRQEFVLDQIWMEEQLGTQNFKHAQAN